MVKSIFSSNTKSLISCPSHLIRMSFRVFCKPLVGLRGILEINEWYCFHLLDKSACFVKFEYCDFS